MTNVISPRTNGIASEVTLLPCPWCGKADKLKMHPRKTRHYDKPLQSVMCARCGTRGRYQLTEERAVTAWNIRPLDDATVEMAQRIQSLELECAKLQEELKKAGTCELEPLPAIVVTMNALNEIGWCKCSECGYATPDESNYCQNCGKAVKR